MKLYIVFIIINFIISDIIDSNDNIPEFFDSREKWPNCISKIYDQKTCGACYAMSIAAAFSMRFCIKNNISQIIHFSPQNLINCLSGCKGEFPDIVWNYINENGITSDKCLSYQNRANSCNIKCDSINDNFNKYYSGKAKLLESEISIKKEIMKNGPVTSMLNLYKDYYNYKSGIYIHDKEENILGFHAIVIIGWGIEDNIKYWIIQDSYGTSKGENGYMRIKIGDKSGAGATAYCDEIEENDYYNISIANNNDNSKNANNVNKRDNNNNNENKYNNQIFIFIKYFFLLSLIFIL